MMVNRDFVELLQSFDDHEVEFLIVGAHALAAHGHVRATKDLDVFLRATARNKRASGRLQDLADIERLESADD
jgi:catalase